MQHEQRLFTKTVFHLHHFSLNCLKFNMFIKFFKLCVFIYHDIMWLYSYQSGKKKKGQGGDKANCMAMTLEW